MILNLKPLPYVTWVTPNIRKNIGMEKKSVSFLTIYFLRWCWTMLLFVCFIISTFILHAEGTYRTFKCTSTAAAAFHKKTYLKILQYFCSYQFPGTNGKQTIQQAKTKEVVTNELQKQQQQQQQRQWL